MRSIEMPCVIFLKQRTVLLTVCLCAFLLDVDPVIVHVLSEEEAERYIDVSNEVGSSHPT